MLARYIQTLRARWAAFWFAPTLPMNLGVCRLLFLGSLFLLYFHEDFSAWAGVSLVFWMPIKLFSLLHLPVLAQGTIRVLQVIWKAALLLSCVGLLTRASTIASFVLGVYLLGLPNNFGKMHHFDAPVVLMLGILALSRCGDGLSIDEWLSPKYPPPSGEYTWPTRAAQLVMALVFFAAGFSKLSRSGLEWIFSNNLSILLVNHQYHLANAEPLTSWGLWVAQHGWICKLLAGATVSFELGSPLALFSRTARWIVVPGVTGMLVGIRLFMGPTFEQLVICQLFWIPWNRWLSARHSPARRFSSLRFQ